MVMFKKWVSNKDLVISLITKEFKVRYKNSVLGFLWTILYPLMMILVFLLVFTKLFRYDLPYYPSYLLIGLIVWNYFSDVSTKNISLFIEQANICTKIPISKTVFVFSSILFGTIDFLLKFLILLSILLILKIYLNWPSLLTINWTFILIIPTVFIQFLLILGVSFVLSIVYVYLRDLTPIWGVIIQIGFFLTPIFYPESLIPYKFILIINPMYHIITIFRSVMIHGEIPLLDHFFLAGLFSFGMLIIGFYVFNKTKDRIIDRL